MSAVKKSMGPQQYGLRGKPFRLPVMRSRPIHDQDRFIACRLAHIGWIIHVGLCRLWPCGVLCEAATSFVMTPPPNKSPEPTAVGACRSLSRFTPRVGGGSAFFVRPHYTHITMNTLKVPVLLRSGSHGGVCSSRVVCISLNFGIPSRFESAMKHDRDDMVAALQQSQHQHHRLQLSRKRLTVSPQC